MWSPFADRTSEQETAFDRKRFRGLSPATTLILTHKGAAFALTAKQRKLVGRVEETYLACDALQAHISRLYRDAGPHDCSNHSGRRTFATRLVAQDHDIEIVQRLFGHADLDHTDVYLDVDRRALEAMFATAV